MKKIIFQVCVYITFYYYEIYFSENGSEASSGSRKSSLSQGSQKGVKENQDGMDQELHEDDENEENRDAHLDLKPVQLTEEEFDTIYTVETRARAITLLIYFSILMVVIPFSSMYYCYYYVFESKFYIT